MLRIISNMICATFEKDVGRWQDRQEKSYGMFIKFRLKTDYEIEEGYRHLQILIYAPANYVGVFAREDWTVIPDTELELQDGDPRIKEGCDYREGDTGWKLLSYHDSCWRSDGVDSVLRAHRDDIVGIDHLIHWYERKEITPEFLKVLEPLMHREGDYGYKAGEGVLRFRERVKR